jgi:hypothetical protein
MPTATLQTIVRDPRTGKVHLPSETVEILGIMQNLDRTLLRVKWQGGGDCVVFPTDIEEQYTPSQCHGTLLH